MTQTKKKNVKQTNNNTNIIGNIAIVIVIMAVIVLAIVATSIKKPVENNTTTTQEYAIQNAGFNEISLTEYLTLINSTEKTVILVARPTCGYCEKFTPILKQAASDMGITVNYIDTDNFSSDDWTKFQNSFDYLSTDEWGTPLTMIVQNGELLAKNNGYVELSAIKQFFTDNGLGD